MKSFGAIGCRLSWRGAGACLAALTALQASAGGAWREIPPARWRTPRAAVADAGRDLAVVVAYPARPADAAVCVTAADEPPGLYEVRLTLRPSHTADVIAFHTTLRARAGAAEVATWAGPFFARVHQPETRTVAWVHAGGPLAVSLTAETETAVAERHFMRAFLDRGGPALGAAAAGEADLLADLDLALSPATGVYYILDGVAYRRLSGSGHVAAVTRDKIRYRPGDLLRGSATVADAGGRGGEGVLTIHLERGLGERTAVTNIPLRLAPAPQTVPFSFTLPEVELGYAVVAEYRGSGQSDGDRSEAAEYFTVAANFNRVYIAGGGGGGHGSTRMDEAAMRRMIATMVANYANAAEQFAWAEEDMVEMSPETDFWFSGQTCYHLSKEGLQRLIRLSHEYGVARVSYAKFVMSGYLGWKTAYDYPNDHRGQYHFPVGMWDGVDVPVLDRFRNKEFIIYERTPGRIGPNPFTVFWQHFLAINPDRTPRMVRIAAEEVVRSVEMFGWDGIRWDGHPHGGGQRSVKGSYDAAAARRTQALVRYFKEIVGARYPHLGHGYNYLHIQRDPDHAWAIDDFETDELCRGGGLLMDESIGNGSAGWTFESIARNLQVEGDLCRERGGFHLGISFAKSPRDVLIESALWAASGTRPHNEAMAVAVRRYCTRYAAFVFDENLRRLARPEGVLAPLGETRLWWQPFVYETPPEAGGNRRLVVNLLNIPRQARRPKNEGAVPEWEMPQGSAPVAFALTLPPGLRATAARLIDPWTLEVRDLALADDRFEIPAVAIWSVAVIDLEAGADAPALAALYGPPRTFGVPRPDRAAEPPPEVVLDTSKDVRELARELESLAPAPRDASRARAEQAALDALPWAARNARILERRADNPVAALTGGWWKGGALPADLKRQADPPEFGDLAPRRNGRFDIFHGRGAMDYRLRLHEVFAGLDRFSVHDAPLSGKFRAGGGHRLLRTVGGRRYPEFDLLLFTGIPHDAIGVADAYALAATVKAGGAALFTGGEYAFGKGGYTYTVLERDLLPVLCVETVDTRASEAPLPLEPGPAFAELGVASDFGERPVFWVWNQVALKDDPGVKVFLRSGNRPVLVGWEVGAGRVACLLIDHRGRSEPGVTAYFDWAGWPALVRALLAWLAPDADRVGTGAPPALTESDRQALLADLDAAALEDLLAVMPQDAEALPDLAEAVPGGGTARDPIAHAQRLERLRAAVRADDPALLPSLGERLAAAADLPPELRFELIDGLRRLEPAPLTELARRCLASPASAVRGAGLHLLAAAQDPAFAARMTGGDPPFETDPAGRRRDRALALLLYGCDDLVAEGRRRVGEWNEQERRAKEAYTGGKGFSLETPEGPLLEKDALFERAAWLAYLVRHDPEAYGEAFAREWLLTAQYEEYADRSESAIWGDKALTAGAKRIHVADMRHLRLCLGRLRFLAEPDLRRLLEAHPAVAAAGMARARFQAEVREALNLLGSFPRGAPAEALARLREAAHPDLAAFAAARAP